MMFLGTDPSSEDCGAPAGVSSALASFGSSLDLAWGPLFGPTKEGIGQHDVCCQSVSERGPVPTHGLQDFYSSLGPPCFLRRRGHAEKAKRKPHRVRSSSHAWIYSRMATRPG